MTVKVVVPVVSQAARFRCVHACKTAELGVRRRGWQFKSARLGFKTRKHEEKTWVKFGSIKEPENGLKPNKDIRIEKAAPHGAALVRGNPAMAGAQSRETQSSSRRTTPSPHPMG
jgi:hypothetical protein